MNRKNIACTCGVVLLCTALATASSPFAKKAAQTGTAGPELSRATNVAAEKISQPTTTENDPAYAGAQRPSKGEVKVEAFEPNVTRQGGDTCATATVIGSVPFSSSGTTVGFANDYDEVCPFTGSTAADVVYSFAPAADMVVDISLCTNSNYDSKLYVYEDVCPAPGSGLYVACNDDSCTTPSFPSAFVSMVEDVSLFAGHTYYIVIDGYSTSTGNYTLDIVPAVDCVVECPLGGIPELEACGADTNGGCNITPNSFEPYVPGTTVCGTGWFDGATRDTDWYAMTILDAAELTITVEAEFPALIGFVETIPPGIGDCAFSTGSVNPAAFPNECIVTSVSVIVPAGTYWPFVAPLFGDPVVCGENSAYTMTVTVAEPPTGACCYGDGTCAEDIASVDCTAGGGTYMGDDLLCAEVNCEGACCYPDGSCIDGTEDSCLGTFQGLGTECASTVCPIAPANDPCGSAMEINEVMNLPFDTTTATFDGPGTCQTSRNLWYCYEATVTGPMFISLCGSSYDTYLGVYDGCTCSPVGATLACVDDNGPVCSGLQSSAQINVVAGNTYLIEVGGFSTNFGTGFLSIFPPPEGACCLGAECSIESAAECATLGGIYVGDDSVCDPNPCQPPANDHCEDAIEIFDGNTDYNSSFADTDGPAHPGTCQFDGQTYHDVWFTYTSTCTGTLVVSTCNQALYDTDLVVYDDCACQFALLGCNDDGPGCAGFSSFLEVPVLAGNCYTIRAGGYQEGSFGAATLSVNCIEAPIGACCNPFGAPFCTQEYEVTCVNEIGGTYLGDDTFCTTDDCNENGIPDECDIAAGTSEDCNGNGIPDECDLASGTSFDLNGNGVPDECDPDCNENGIPDNCDTSCDGVCGVNFPDDCGDSFDCNANFIPDECELGARDEFVYLWDDGSSEDALGLTAGGEMAWIHGFQVVEGSETITAIQTTWGSALGFGSGVDPGETVRVYVWEDPDDDGNPDDAVLVHVEVTTADGAAIGTDILQTIELSDGVEVAGWFFVGASAEHPGGTFPAAMDTSSPDGNSWIGYVVGGVYDPSDIGGQEAAPLNMNSIGFPSDFLLRAVSSAIGADCNGNGIPDDCDVAPLCQAGQPGYPAVCSDDCNSDLVPDECQLEGNDCNANGTPDDCDILSGESFDCNENGIPDECDLGGGTSLDCNENGVPDECDIAHSVSEDCNENAIPDECDIASGASEDCQLDGIPDECQLGEGGGVVDAVTDGSFEAGPGSGNWEEFSLTFGTPLCDSASCGLGGGTAGPRTGNWWVWFGGSGGPYETGYVSQDVTIPASSGASLEVYIWIGATGGDGSDYVSVSLDGDVLATVLEGDPVYTGGYALLSIDVSAYADGGVHDLLIESETFGPGNTNFSVDDVALLIDTGAPSNDCNVNDIPDECDIASGFSEDCQPNGVPDECDIANGTSEDTDGNGVPDECDGPACPWDQNGDGVVNPLDVAAVKALYGCPVGTGNPACDQADVDGSGSVNPLDVAGVKANYGPCP